MLCTIYILIINKFVGNFSWSGAIENVGYFILFITKKLETYQGVQGAKNRLSKIM